MLPPLCRGTVVATTEHDEAIVYADINLDKVDEVFFFFPCSGLDNAAFMLTLPCLPAGPEYATAVEAKET